MNSFKILTLLSSLIFSNKIYSKSDLERLFDKAKKEFTHEIEKRSPQLTSNEIVGGLKEALKVGANSATSNASKMDGFFKNPRISIPLPDEVKGASRLLNQLGLKSLTQNFTLSMNRGAEAASKLAIPIFVNSITKMTFSDAKKILSSQNNAATEYLKKTCTPELNSAFLPIVDKSLKKVNATRYWSDITTAYNSINLIQPIETNLNQYVTTKALDGLFLLIADEEKKIRQNPLGQANELIRKVFSQK